LYAQLVINANSFQVLLKDNPCDGKPIKLIWERKQFYRNVNFEDHIQTKTTFDTHETFGM